MPAKQRADNKKQIGGFFLDTLADEFDDWERHGFKSRTDMMEFCFETGLKRLHAEKVGAAETGLRVRATRETKLVAVLPGRGREEWGLLSFLDIPSAGDRFQTRSRGILAVKSRTWVVDETTGHLDEIRVELKKP